MKYIRVFLTYFLSGLLLGGSLLFIFNPLPGLATFIALISICIMFIAPIFHIIVMKAFGEAYVVSHFLVAGCGIGTIFIFFIILAINGNFHFT